MDPAARTTARIAGPALVALAATERANMGIFAAQTAPVVYLNGTLLLVAGLAIVQAHNRWRWGWPLAVTLLGWAALAVGLVRMSLPQAPQLHEGPGLDALFVLLALLGAALSVLGYRRARTP